MGNTILIILLVISIAVVLYFLLGNRQSLNDLKTMQRSNQALDLMQKQVESLRDQVNNQLGEVNRQLIEATGQIGKRLDGQTQVIGNVYKNLGELGEASKQIYEIGKDISSLQDILAPPKLRGVLGEVFLEELLSQLVPTSCDFQYRFKSQEIVDAIIRIGERIVPVDAKFPLENFRKMLNSEDDEQSRAQHRKAFTSDVRKHIDAIASKYILPDEGTYDFALMYIPAENVYYEIITKEEKGGSSISEYALQKRVIPVSPNTIYAYLQVIIFGLKGLQVEKHAQEIIHHLDRLRGDFAKFEGTFEILGTHLANAAKKYDEAEKKLVKIDDKLLLTGELSSRGLDDESGHGLPAASGESEDNEGSTR